MPEPNACQPCDGTVPRNGSELCDSKPRSQEASEEQGTKTELVSSAPPPMITLVNDTVATELACIAQRLLGVPRDRPRKCCGLASQQVNHKLSCRTDMSRKP
jgi:hypothetical protein